MIISADDDADPADRCQGDVRSHPIELVGDHHEPTANGRSLILPHSPAAPLAERGGGVPLGAVEHGSAAARLKEVEARHGALVELIPAIAYVESLDAGRTSEGTLLYVGPQIEALLGYPVDDWLSTPGLWYRLLHPDDRTHAIAEDARTEATGKPYRADYRLCARDGRYVWFRDEAVLLRNGSGEPRFWQGVMLDVTEHKEAEAALRASEARFRALVERSSDLISIVDVDGVRRYASPAYEHVLGYRPQDLIGRPVGAINHPDDVERERRFLLDLARRPGGVGRFDARVLHRDGSTRWLEVVGANRLDDPAVTGVVVNSRDVTERKEAEEALREGEQRHRELAAAAQRQALELALLDQARTALAQELELPAHFRAVVEAVAATFGYTQVSLYLVEGSDLVLQHQVGYPRQLDRIPVATGVMGRVARSGEPTLIEDVRADPAFLGAIEGITSEICVPLRDNERIVGTLNVASTGGVALTAADLRLVQALANHVDVAIARGRLAAAERRERARTGALLRAAEALNRVGSLEDLMVALAAVAAEAVDADRVSVYAYDETRTRSIASGRYDAERVGARPQLPAEPATIDAVSPLEIPAEAEVIRIGRPLARDGSTPYPPRFPPSDWRSDVVVPLLATGSVQGVLYVRDAGRERVFQEDEVEILLAIGQQAGLAILRARDATAAQRRADHLALLNQVGRALSASLDVDDLCAAIHHEVVRVLAADAFFVALYEPSSDQIWFPYLIDGGRRTEGERVPLNDGPTSHVVRTHRSYVRTGVDDPVAAAGTSFGYRERRTASALYVPMLHDDQLVGVLSVHRYDPGAYGDDDLRTLETIAQQATAAFRNAALLAEAGEARARAERRADHLALVNRVGRALSESLDVDELCADIHAEVGQVLAVDAFYVALYKEGDTQIWFPYLFDDGECLPPNWLPLGDGPTSRVLRTKRPDVVAPGWDAEGPRGDFLGVRRRSAAALHVPMLRGGRLIGALSVQRYDPAPFDDDDLRTLETIAQQAAAAFAHARLYADTVAGRDAATRHAADLEAVLTITRSIASATDLGTVLDALADELAVLVPHKLIALYRVTPDGTSLSPVFAHKRGERFDASDWALGIDEGLVGRAFATGRAELVNDAHLDPRSSYPRDEAEYRDAGLHVALAPLVVAGQRVGVLELSRLGGERFDREEFSLFRVLAEQAAAAIRSAELIGRNRELYLGVVRALASAVDAKDPYTRGHSERVSRLAGRIAAAIRLDPAEVEAIELAALLHDVGKIGVPDAILQKPGPLDDAERAIMVGHADLGADILAGVGIAALRPLVPLIRHHHERVDGGGYPDALAGDAIPDGAAIIAAADAFDTITTDRPYRPAQDASDAIGELRRLAGSQFRGDVVAALADLVREDGLAPDQPSPAVTPGDGWSTYPVLEPTPSGGQMGDTRALGLFVELAAVTRHIPNLAGFLAEAVGIIRRRLGYQDVMLMLVDLDRKELVLAAHAGSEASVRADHRQPLDIGVLGEVVRTGRPWNVPDIGQEPRYHSERRAPRGSELAVPLVVDETTIGVINAESDRVAAFTAADEAVLSAVAGQLAAAVHVAQLHDAAKRAAATDGLTGLANHRAFYHALHKATAAGQPLSVLLLDVEGLKRVNDSAGHLAGDALLRRVARAIRGAARPEDVMARYGGDEFAVIMPGLGREEAARVGARLRRELAEAGGADAASATVRYGVAASPEDGVRPIKIVAAADRRLYEMRDQAGADRSRPARA